MRSLFFARFLKKAERLRKKRTKTGRHPKGNEKNCPNIALFGQFRHKPRFGSDQELSLEAKIPPIKKFGVTDLNSESVNSCISS